VLQEIDYASQVKQDRSKILVIYDNVGIEQNAVAAQKVTSFHFNPREKTVDQVIGDVLLMVDAANRQERQLGDLKNRLKKAEDERNVLAAFLGIGVGLFALSALSGEEPKASPKKGGGKKTTKKRPKEQ